jgi:hypothetical protein
VNDLSADALVTLEEARRYVWRDENDGSRDDLLIDAINLVSAAIAVYCEREFAAGGAPATRSFPLGEIFADGRRVGWIDLTPYDLRSATAVTLHTDTLSPRTLSAEEYRLRPVGGALGGTYLGIVTIAPLVPEAQPGFGWEAQVEGLWGMASVPDEVQLACLQWVANIVRNPGSFASESMAGYTVTPELDLDVARAGMPASVRHRLHPYRRRP